jgi:hypothetical protein
MFSTFLMKVDHGSSMDDYKKSSHINYEIKIKGRLEKRWTEWFEGLTFSYESDGTTTLSGSLPDQAALHSILLKIRDMNLTLISVTQSESNPEEES